MPAATTETATTEAKPTGKSADGRGIRRTITGTVTSNAMDKTIVVSVVRRVRDRRFHKFLTRRVKYKAHDENNTSGVGDVVEIIESRAYSKTKKWRLLRTVSKAEQIDVKEVLP